MVDRVAGRGAPEWSLRRAGCYGVIRAVRYAVDPQALCAMLSTMLRVWLRMMPPRQKLKPGGKRR